MGAELGRADPEDRRKGTRAWRESTMHENERVAIIGTQKESSPRQMQKVKQLSTPQRTSNEPSELGPFFTCRPEELPIPSAATPSRRFHAGIGGSPETRPLQTWAAPRFQSACEHPSPRTRSR